MGEKILQQFLTNVLYLDENVITGDLAHNGKIVARYFLDLGYPNEAPEADAIQYLTDFQDKYIVAKYFSEPGSLQWNYYLIIVSESVSDETRHKIENEKSYTRKIVLKSSELESYFDYIKDDGTQLEDIVEIWRSKLAEGDLDCVFTTESYTNGVPNYLSGNFSKAMPDENILGPSVELAIGTAKVDKIALGGSYRQFPAKREFELGTVNLISGVNGSGKTSLIEAVEFGYCGRILRNPNENDSNPDVSVKFMGMSEMETVNVNERRKYRERDRYWYGYSANAVVRQDRIQFHFNTFNFFSSDAAFRLSNIDSEMDFEKALGRLIAGPDASVLLERIDGFLRRFEEIYFREEGRKNELSSSIEKNRNYLSELVLSDEGVILSFQVLKTFVEERLSPAPFPQDSGSDISQFDHWLRTIQVILRGIDDQNHEKDDPNPADLARTIQVVNEGLKQYENLSRELEDSDKQLRVLEKELNSRDRVMLILENAINYLQVEDIAAIVGIVSSIEELELQIKAIGEQRNLFEEINWDLLGNRTVVYESLIEELSQQIRKKQQDHRELSAIIKKLREGLSELNKVRAEIKDLGKKFVQISPDATSCPMCNTPYGAGELQDRILMVLESATNSIEATDLPSRVLEIEAEGKLLVERHDLLEKLGSFTAMDFEGNWKSLTIEVIISNIESHHGQITTLTEKLDKLKQASNHFKSKGLTETGYKEAFEAIQSLTLDDKIIEANHDSLIKSQEKVAAELSIRKKDKEALLEKRQELTDKLDSVISLRNYGLSGILGQSSVEVLRGYKKRLEKLLFHLNELHEIFPNHSFPFVQQLQADLVEVDVLYSAFQKQSVLMNEANSLRSRIESEISNSTVELNELSPRLDRGIRAVRILKDIKKNHSLQAHVSSFILANQSQILEIFQEIHSPREFSDFRYEGNGVQLYRSTPGKWVELQEVSTGQRAALALAIFLSLNRNLGKGPNVLIFDDPVTFIDDLNMLGFLDFLRKLVLHEDRQIIFATASDKIGILFQRKFDFLQHEFKTFNLERA